MSQIEDILIKNIEVISSAMPEIKSLRGRSKINAGSLYGINRIRRLILDLALKGKLVEQKELSSHPNHAEGDTGRSINNLPGSWNYGRLGDIANLITKGTTPTSMGHAYQSTGIRFVKVENISDGYINLLSINQYISEEVDAALSRSRLKANDLLFSIAGTIGRACIVRDSDLPANTNQALAIIRGTDKVFFPPFLLRQLNSFVADQIVNRARGGAMNNVSLSDLSDAMLVIPPYEEQLRISKKIDDLMALCDILEAKSISSFDLHEFIVSEVLSNLRQQKSYTDFERCWDLISSNFHTLFTTVNSVSRLRGTLLNLAVSGKLAPQNKTEDPAEDLFTKIQGLKSDVLIKGKKVKNQAQALHLNRSELPDGWIACKFGDLVINRDSERIPVSAEARQTMSGAYDYYGASGVIDKVNDYLFDEPLLLIGEDGANLINRSTPIAFMAHGKYWVNNHAHVLGGINVDFLRYLELYINSIDLRPYITGTAQPKMNQAKMNSIEVWVPPAAEQLRILSKLEELLDFCDQLEQKINQLNVMKRKIADVLVEQALA